MKQRLVGTLVIGCLAIIFIPILLDGEGISPPAMTSTIPQAPPRAVVPDVSPQRSQASPDTLPEPDVFNNTGQDREPQVADTTAATPPAPERPRLDSSGIPETWSVRLGSFAELANAEALVTRLRDNGYKGFSRPLETSRGTLTGVYVGPVLTQAEAARLQQELAQAYELEGVVVQFSIDPLAQ